MKPSIAINVLLISGSWLMFVTSQAFALHTINIACPDLKNQTTICGGKSTFKYLVGEVGLSNFGGARIGQQIEQLEPMEIQLPSRKIWQQEDIQLPTDTTPRPNDTYSPQEKIILKVCSDELFEFRSNFSATAKLNPSHFPLYTEACTKKLETSEFSNTAFIKEDIATKEALRARIIQSVASIELKDGSVCTAFIASKEHVLTARHCYQRNPNKEILTNAFGVLKGRDSRGVAYEIKSLKLASDPISKSRLTQGGVSLPNHWSKDKIDFVILTPTDLEGFKVENPIEIKYFETLAEGTPLILASRFKLGDKDAGLRVDELPSCKVVLFMPNDGYMKHRCQAIPGGSGAPIFVFQLSNVFMIGMHVAPEGKFSSDNSQARENEGILLPPDLSSWITLPVGPIGANSLLWFRHSDSNSAGNSKIFTDRLPATQSSRSIHSIVTVPKSKVFDLIK